MPSLGVLAMRPAQMAIAAALFIISFHCLPAQALVVAQIPAACKVVIATQWQLSAPTSTTAAQIDFGTGLSPREIELERLMVFVHPTPRIVGTRGDYLVYPFLHAFGNGAHINVSGLGSTVPRGPYYLWNIDLRPPQHSNIDALRPDAELHFNYFLSQPLQTKANGENAGAGGALQDSPGGITIVVPLKFQEPFTQADDAIDSILDILLQPNPSSSLRYYRPLDADSLSLIQYTQASPQPPCTSGHTFLVQTTYHLAHEAKVRAILGTFLPRTPPPAQVPVVGQRRQISVTGYLAASTNAPTAARHPGSFASTNQITEFSSRFGDSINNLTLRYVLVYLGVISACLVVYASVLVFQRLRFVSDIPEQWSNPVDKVSFFGVDEDDSLIPTLDDLATEDEDGGEEGDEEEEMDEDEEEEDDEADVDGEEQE